MRPPSSTSCSATSCTCIRNVLFLRQRHSCSNSGGRGRRRSGRRRGGGGRGGLRGRGPVPPEVRPHGLAVRVPPGGSPGARRAGVQPRGGHERQAAAGAEKLEPEYGTFYFTPGISLHGKMVECVKKVAGFALQHYLFFILSYYYTIIIILSYSLFLHKTRNFVSSSQRLNLQSVSYPTFADVCQA